MPASNVLGRDVQEQLVLLKRLTSHVWKHFKEDRCFEEAASLGYTSLLALVPLLAVIFGVVAAFPVFAQWSIRLQSFIFHNLMPAAGVQVESYLATFLESVAGLTLPGTITLILTALLLMFRIEIAFNRIWRVGRSRSLTGRVIVYWAVLTLAPILIGAAIAMSAQKILGGVTLQESLTPVAYRAGIFLISWMVFALIFVLVPYRRVNFRDALAGALLSAVLFELAKLGFVAYFSNANFTVIYGALAAVPIFLFWLYLVWIVVLLGASLAASLTTFRERPRAGGNWPPWAEFQMAYRLVGHLWTAQRLGKKCAHEELLKLEPRVGERQMLEILQRLEQASMITRDEEGDWILARDAAELTLSELYRCGEFHLPLVDRQDVPVESVWDRAFIEVLQDVLKGGMEHLNRPVRDLYLAGEKQ
jgi:membrane protein